MKGIELERMINYAFDLYCDTIRNMYLRWKRYVYVYSVIMLVYKNKFCDDR